MKIWKYPLGQLNSVRDSAHKIVIAMKRGSRPLHVGMQDGTCFVWVEVDPDQPDINATFFSVGTGHGAVPEGCVYLGTVHDKEFVWHVYHNLTY